MIIIKESLTIEYETAEERKSHVIQMIKDGYTLTKEYSTLDIFYHPGKEHIVAEYEIEREGHPGKTVL